jgi:hypothetical protein
MPGKFGKAPGINYSIGEWTSGDLRKWLMQNISSLLPQSLQSQDAQLETVTVGTQLSLSPAANTDLKDQLGITGAGASPDDANPIMDGVVSPGVSTLYSRGDHVHPTDTTRAAVSDIPVPAASTPVVDGTGSVGTSAKYAREDHVHPTDTTRAAVSALPVPATATPLVDGTGAVGTGAKYAREDHVHPTDTTRAPLASPALTGTPTAPTAAANTNSTQLATTAFVLGQASATSPAMDGTAAVGTSSAYARGDHVHPTDTSRAPVNNPTFTTQAVVSGPLIAARVSTQVGTANEIDLWSDGHIYFGSASDTNLYRAAANLLQTDDTFNLNGGANTGIFASKTSESQPQVGLQVDGKSTGVGRLFFGPGGSTAPDTSLYRPAANLLQTDGTFNLNGGANTGIFASKTGEAQPQVGIQVDGKSAGVGRLFFGPGGSTSPDTSLYRAASNALKTDGSFDATSFKVAGTTQPKITTSAISSGPPSSPSDGDIWIATGVDARGTRWQFQYNAGSSSSFKWEFIGGPPLAGTFGGAVTNLFSGSGTVDLTSGPTLTVPRSGDYVVRVGCFMQNNGTYSGAAQFTCTPTFSTKGALPPIVCIATGQWGGGNNFEELPTTGLTSGETAKLQVSNNSASSNAAFFNGQLAIIPIRVS